RIRVRDVAGHLLDIERAIEERKRLRRIVPGLQFGTIVVDGPPVKPWWSSGFETFQSNANSREGSANASGSTLPCPSASRLRLAGMHQGLQECPRGEDNGRRAVDGTSSNLHTGHRWT